MTAATKGWLLLVGGLMTYALLCVAIALLARAGFPPSRVTLALAASFAPYVMVCVAAPTTLSSEQARRLGLVALAVFGLVWVFAPPVLSDDVFRFVWEGRLWREGFNPYRLAPNDPALLGLRDDDWQSINNKPLASIYPPLAQALFVVAALLGGGVATMKLIALAAHLLTVRVIGSLSDDPRASLAIALNPLLLSASALDGHLDVLVGLALAVSACALATRRIARASVATVCAVGLKLVGLVLTPLFLRSPRALCAILASSAALVLPMVVFRPPVDTASGPLQFADRWRGNESVFAGVEWLTRALIPDESAATLARALCVGAVFALCFLLAVRRVPPVRAARVVLWATLLLSPQVHPWYLAWLLPLEAVAGRVSGFVWSAAALVAYLPLDRWLAEGVWEPSPSLRVFEYGVVAAVLGLEAWHNRRNLPMKTGG